MNSTTRDKIKPWAVLFWIGVWELIARLVGQEILLVSPVTVLLRFLELVITMDFWKSIGFSLLRIGGGFFIALLVGILMACGSHAYQRLRDIILPLMEVIKATPVASFTIIVLIWIPSKNLSVIISFLMVLPIIYTNLLNGLSQTDGKLLEMAKVFQVPFHRKVRSLYIPHLLPFLNAACILAIGMSWKAGIAAEVIGIPRGSIGERLQEAKIYLNTPDLFAWTLTVILTSVVFEKSFLSLLKWAGRKLA